MTGKPALLGGPPAFAEPLAFAQPTRESTYNERAIARIGASLESGALTDGSTVRELENRFAERVGVEHVIAVSSATIGLLLVLQAIDSSGPVLIPSFTFSATAHAARWNGMAIRFADCDPHTWCLAGDGITDDMEVIVGVHVSGVPCDVELLARGAASADATLIFDAAHGAGSSVTIDGRRAPLGSFGLAEVFSLTPTKVMSGAEGGLITTKDDNLASHLRMARNYGNPGDYDTQFAGLNARLSELHAALALESLSHLDERVELRNALAERYRSYIDELPGVGYQHVPEGMTSSVKDFTITIDESSFGVGRNVVDAGLRAEGIDTRRYYSPPVHLQTAYRDVETPPLPVTERLAASVITLPMWSHLPLEDVDRVGNALVRIQAHAAEIEASLQPE